MTSIDWDTWHALMIERGWIARRDMFGVITRYEFETPARVLVLHASNFAQWAGLMDTPPPF